MTVEVLIKAVDHIHVDSVKDARGSWKQGDVVDIKPGGHVWGAKEVLPKFWHLTVTNVDLGDQQLDTIIAPGTGCRRDSSLDPTSLPSAAEIDMLAGNSPSVNFGQFNAALQGKP